MKKALGVISNIVSVFLVGPFSIYFSSLGLLFLIHSDFAWSLDGIIYTLSSVSFLCTLPICVIGIILSIVFRKKAKYKDSYLIQLLPFASVITGVFLMVVSMFWSNP